MLDKLLILFFTITVISSHAQTCELTVFGKVADKGTLKPIEFASIYVEELTTGVVSDLSGNFELKKLCGGEYHLVISHIGCETQNILFRLSSDTTCTFYVEHSSELINEVTIENHIQESKSQEEEVLNVRQINQQLSKSLGQTLEDISGVSMIKNGNGVSKPVVHGLYGNRLLILNNGIAQSGQQWGFDHAPEIDPLVANRITVVKGVGAVEFMGNSLGSVILVDPKKIEKEPHLHGKARYFFNSNELGNGVNLELQQYNKWFGWKVNGSIKKIGDANTPNYFLTNTGFEEYNFAAELEKQITTKWTANVYYSSFNTQIGILRGSQVGNLTDLQTAFEREEPFFTQDDFSYDIQNPRQEVNHHLLKASTKYLFSEQAWVELVYAKQLNYRKEFDVRRGGRGDKPSLSLDQESDFFEAKFHYYFKNEWHLKSGIQVNRVNNQNIPETGILPLIPNYLSNERGAFLIATKSFKKLKLELGARVEEETRKVATISISVPREILNFENKYLNYIASSGMQYSFSDQFSMNYNVGLAARNPEVNELYSNGLHQGVSGIEEGDINLDSEQAIKNTLSFATKKKDKFFAELLLYHQYIQDYIYLQAQDEFRLTIRGAFPVFKYEQTDAQIYGLDFVTKYQINEKLLTELNYSFIRGNEIDNGIALINLPSNSILSTTSYQIPEVRSLKNVELQMIHKYVFEQRNITEEQDFVAPPEGYYLLGFRVSAEKQLKGIRLEAHLGVENALNTEYRDYLNRQRYFADELGRNYTVGLVLKF